MKIKKPNQLQRAYIDAVGCRPVAFLQDKPSFKISIDRDFWSLTPGSRSAFWFVDENTAKLVKKETLKILSTSENVEVEDFIRALSSYCSRFSLHNIPNVNLINMADSTIEIVEKEYGQRKSDGYFKPYFKAQKEARQMAKLLGQKVQSAAQDEVDLKITILRHAIERGR